MHRTFSLLLVILFPPGIQSYGPSIYCAHLISRIYPVVNVVLAVFAAAHAVSAPPYERPECHCITLLALVSTYTYDSVLVNPPLLCSSSLGCKTTCSSCMVCLCFSMCMCCWQSIVYECIRSPYKPTERASIK
ncbi:uncharacterized protein SCHCODRAFT_02061927, partial [Schizophyllum commune H4-8]|uniref:uncharacterized protein n=1 Tax=Schizophyllum commune (strain H4-8 / FGSC 9210) TaxID=578458 RepID=UPI0021607691